MIFARTYQRQHSWLVRLSAVASIAALLMATVGIPVWSAGGGKDLSSPFPCMYRQCGCRSAEQCWKSCCCFTDREKVAWAKEHGLEGALPAFVIAAAADEERCDVQTETTKASSCCRQKVASKTAPKSCCAAKNETAASTESHIEASGEVHILTLFEALTCRGQVEQWVSLGAMALPTINDFRLELPLVDAVCARCVGVESPHRSPPTPPPCI